MVSSPLEQQTHSIVETGLSQNNVFRLLHFEDGKLLNWDTPTYQTLNLETHKYYAIYNSVLLKSLAYHKMVQASSGSLVKVYLNRVKILVR